MSGGIAKMKVKLERFGNPKAWAKFKDQAAVLMKQALLATFDQGRDPYGKTWAPRVLSYGHPPLNKTGDLRGSIDVKATAGGLAQSAGDPKATWHQDGTKRMPARPFLARRGLPRGGMTLLKKLVREVFR